MTADRVEVSPRRATIYRLATAANLTAADVAGVLDWTGTDGDVRVRVYSAAARCGINLPSCEQVDPHHPRLRRQRAALTTSPGARAARHQHPEHTDR